MRLGLIMAFSPFSDPGLPRRPHLHHVLSDLKAQPSYALDKIDILSKSFCERHGTQRSKRTWPATSSRLTRPPTAPGLGWSSTTRCSMPPSSRARAPTRRCSASSRTGERRKGPCGKQPPRLEKAASQPCRWRAPNFWRPCAGPPRSIAQAPIRSEEHTSELQSRLHLVCRLLLEKKKRTSFCTDKLILSRHLLFLIRVSTTRHTGY